MRIKIISPWILLASALGVVSACDDATSSPVWNGDTNDVLDTDSHRDSNDSNKRDTSSDLDTITDATDDTTSHTDTNESTSTDSDTNTSTATESSSGVDTYAGTDTVSETDTSYDTKSINDTYTSSEPSTDDNTDTARTTDTTSGTAPDTEQDTSSADTDTGSAVSQMTVEITAPNSGALIEGGTALTLKGTATDSIYPENELTAVWKSDVSGILGTVTPDAGGNIELANVNLSLGWHVITLEVENPKGQRAVDAVMVGSCEWSQPETFDEDIESKGWKIYRDAYWDPGGWLEMTGTETSKKGMIFRTDSTVDPGDVSISFSIRTGGGINGGADGFAMSVYNAQDLADLESILERTGIGGCLGYAVEEGCGGQDWDRQIESFHIEIDTWMNNKPGNIMQDPTSSNHIGVMLNGNASNHVLWANTPSIEDQKWHDITVEITGIHVTVTLDDAVIIDGVVPQLDFRGGYIGFSGTTGWASNWHSFDNLNVQQGCVVPL